MFAAAIRCGFAPVLSVMGAAALVETKGEKVPMSWGYNQYGQLGNGTESDLARPGVIGYLEDKDVLSVVSSGPSNSTAAVTASGELYTWGCGKDSRLGHGETIDAPNQTIPRRVLGLEGLTVTSVAVGEYHMAVIVGDGSVYTFGKNRAGQLGHDNTTPGRPEQVPGLRNVVKVACGRQHSVAVDKDGVAYTWGFGTDGALGHGVKTHERRPKQVEALAGHKIVDAACGREFTLFVTAEGKIFSCGLDSNGQLGLGFAHRLQRTPQLVSALGDTVITRVLCGENHSVAISASGDAYSWGWNSSGQLGHGDRNDLGIPRLIDSLEGQVADGAAGGAHTMLLTTSGKVFAFGRGRNGQLGRDNHLESIAAYRTEPVEVDALSEYEVSSLSGGDSHSLCVAIAKK